MSDGPDEEALRPTSMVVRGISRRTHTLVLGFSIALLVPLLLKMRVVTFVFFMFGSSRWVVRRVAHAVLGDGVRAHDGRISIESSGPSKQLVLSSECEGWMGDSIDPKTIMPFETALRLQNGSVLVCCFRDEASARKLLRDAGVDPAVRSITFSLTSYAGPTTTKSVGDRMRTRLAELAVLVVLFAASVTAVQVFYKGPLLGVPLVAACLWLLALPVLGVVVWLTAALANTARPPRVRVGLDGLLVISPFRRVFIPYREVRAVREDDRGVRLQLAKERTLLLPIARSNTLRVPFPLADRVEVANSTEADLRSRRRFLFQVLSERVERAHASTQERALDLVDSALARSPGGTVRPAGDGYRAPSLTDADLLEVLESPAATAQQRIASARVLAKMRVPELDERVRVAVERAADPELKRELREIAEENAADERARADSVAPFRNGT